MKCKKTELIVGYVLNSDKSVSPVYTIDQLLSGPNPSPIGNDTVGDVRVSTVFLAVDHGFSINPNAAPVLFETALAGPDGMEIVERYTTYDDASEGHGRWVSVVAKRGVKQ